MSCGPGKVLADHPGSGLPVALDTHVQTEQVRGADLLIRRLGQVVQDRAPPVVYWADVSASAAVAQGRGSSIGSTGTPGFSVGDPGRWSGLCR